MLWFCNQLRYNESGNAKDVQDKDADTSNAEGGIRSSAVDLELSMEEMQSCAAQHRQERRHRGKIKGGNGEKQRRYHCMLEEFSARFQC